VDKLDVKSITFLDEKVQSRGYGRPGWRETPLAYLLIQAKDASVDQLRAHMDLDFMDQRGKVALPASQITCWTHVSGLTRVRSPTWKSRKLDDREIAEGMTLEVRRAARVSCRSWPTW
jgi:hypothetical protein